ncbi:hypothetical protein [Amycolatopsis sp. H20-H5]|uniref:hypothetical protein n=1 Tax=Amycolatopsis sp. H20-H5 TaxID=3046309 RepID=UPI002DB75CEE|nr:hypothetical protein [Amycolatopsis sp. H20-H5]MEC3980431.1 hypothetical protein [Amycolatopsis sp. H20-H5]
MQADSQADRVAVLEPRPDLPASAMPVFRELVGKNRRRRRRQAIVCLPIAAAGVWLSFGGYGIAAPVLLLAMFVPLTFYLVRCTLVFGRAEKLLGTAFRPLHLESDGVLVSGSKVSLRVPGDGPDWLVMRLPEPARRQLAGQRRVWVLGPDRRGRVLVLLPGSLSVRPGRLRAEPSSGSVPLAELSRTPTSPADDPVVGAHLRALLRVLWVLVGLYVFYAALLVWVHFDFPPDPNPALRDFIPNVSVLLSGLMVVAALGTAASVPRYAEAWRAGTWTELRVVVDGVVRIGYQGMARVNGRTMLADGREITFQLLYVDPSLAANVAVTGQLWIAGAPRPGKVGRAAVPGYPVIGNARFGK